MNPEPGLMGEIQYWHTILFELYDAKREINDHVEAQTEALLEEIQEENSAKDTILYYLNQIDRVYKGLKEAKWNEKYMKVLQPPVEKIITGDVDTADTHIGVLMSTIKSVYENSNFYKEARTLSFLDQLLTSCVSLVTKELPFSRLVSSY